MTRPAPTDDEAHDSATACPARRRPDRGHFDQPDWFKTAVFYEVLVRSFKDSNGDGVGDFRGLTEKLDYLHWLGVDCLWVPPFFSSPLRDGGYDIADYTNILPEAGTVEDFHHFLDEAHKRDIRVIIDFVMNHTSDQHPWFQASREDPDGPYGDFYVWSDTDELYEEARVIFVDTEPSNWTWDPVRQQYFWHRFFSHQPDLNFDNPKVHGGDPRGDELLARHGPRRVPARRGALPLRAPRHQRREPPRDPRDPAQGAQLRRRELPRPGAARARPTSGRPTSSTTSAASATRTPASGSPPATSATCASTSR